MNTQPFKLSRALQFIFSLVLLMCVSACKPAAPESYTVGITGYNFTGEGTQEFYVNGQWGSNIPPYGGGGGATCCIILPAKWRPGLVAEINWTTGHWTLPLEKILPMDIHEARKFREVALFQCLFALEAEVFHEVQVLGHRLVRGLEGLDWRRPRRTSQPHRQPAHREGGR